MLLPDILFPFVGCLAISFGVLTAVFTEASSRIHKKYVENFTLFGRWSSKFYTPEAMRVFGILVASFGVVWLTFALAILFG